MIGDALFLVGGLGVVGVLLVLAREHRGGWRAYQRSLQPRRFPLTARGVAALLGVLVLLGALALALLGCEQTNPTFAQPTADLVPTLDLARVAPDLGQLGAVDLAEVPDLARQAPQADLAPAAPPDLAPARDLAEAVDLAPMCTPVGVTCGAASTCCGDTLPRQIDGKSYCSQTGVCCAIAEIGDGCPGGHFKWCTNCGAGWSCGACQ